MRRKEGGEGREGRGRLHAGDEFKGVGGRKLTARLVLPRGKKERALTPSNKTRGVS